MKKYIFSFLSVMLLSSFSGFAQNDIVIIDRGAGKFQASRKKAIKLNDNISAIKFTPTQMLAGELNFSWEHQLSKKSSIELSAGPTISKISLGLNTHIFDNNGTTETSGIGVFGELGFRYYPLDETEALNRFYVSPVIKFRQYNFGVEDPLSDIAPTKGSKVQLNFLFNFGYQLWASKSFSLDFFGGMGLGMQNYNTAYLESVWVNNEFEFNWVESTYKEARFVFTTGLKIGIGQKAR
ncbi:MAG: hypothetical protein ACI837_002922 [Crocinitomicaceae bacterium]|jgi:hypothetical protein